MINAFASGEDIHTVTASQVFGVPVSSVTGEMRKKAKAVNFGIVYGIGEFSLAGDIGVSRKEAGEYIKSYFEKYRGICAYLEAAVEAAKNLGYVETIFGRRRYIPELTSGKAMLRAFGERVAMNSPIQGSSADIIKLAMINVHRALREERVDARLILQIHDELIVEASRACAERAAQILRREMENVVKLSVPLTVELQMGNSWYECK
jgi:DNA polymerase-1